MRRILLISLVLGMALVAGCGSSRSSRAEAERARAPERIVVPTPSGVLPADEAEGWQTDFPDNRAKVYVRENLYVYAKGDTPKYMDYGFRRLDHGIYRPNLLGQPTVSLDAYMMDTTLDAYGIFSVMRNRKDKMVDIGGGAHIGEKEAVMWKGNTFVRAKLMRDADDAEKTFTYFLTETANRIPGQTTIPALTLFPAENRAPAGDAYRVKDLLGFDFLGQGFTVEYDLDGKTATMFLALAPPAQSNPEADEMGLPMVSPGTQAYVRLRRELIQANETAEVLSGPWQHGCKATHPKLGTGIIARKGGYVFGIFGAPDQDTAIKMAAELGMRL